MKNYHKLAEVFGRMAIFRDEVHAEADAAALEKAAEVLWADFYREEVLDYIATVSPSAPSERARRSVEEVQAFVLEIKDYDTGTWLRKRFLARDTDQIPGKLKPGLLWLEAKASAKAAMLHLQYMEDAMSD